MKFEDLKLIFSENYLITFEVNENASSLFAKYIRISKQNKEDQVYLSNAVHKGEFEINIPCKVESEKYNYKLFCRYYYHLTLMQMFVEQRI